MTLTNDEYIYFRDDYVRLENDAAIKIEDEIFGVSDWTIAFTYRSWDSELEVNKQFEFIDLPIGKLSLLIKDKEYADIVYQNEAGTVEYGVLVQYRD